MLCSFFSRVLNRTVDRSVPVESSVSSSQWTWSWDCSLSLLSVGRFRWLVRSFLPLLLLRLEFGLGSSYAVSLFLVDDCLSLSWLLGRESVHSHVFWRSAWPYFRWSFVSGYRIGILRSPCFFLARSVCPASWSFACIHSRRCRLEGREVYLPDRRFFGHHRWVNHLSSFLCLRVRRIWTVARCFVSICPIAVLCHCCHCCHRLYLMVEYWAASWSLWLLLRSQLLPESSNSV